MSHSLAAGFACNALLRSPEVQNINFSIGPYSINGQGYLKVAAAILMGKMPVDVNPGRLTSDQGARFDPPTNELIFRTAALGSNNLQRMNVVHECTHALIANSGFRWDATYTDSEAAAYVAGALYLSYAVSPLTRELTPDPKFKLDTSFPFQAPGEPFATAERIAHSIRNVKGARVSAKDAIALRGAVIANRTYVKLGVTFGTGVSLNPKRSWD
jgi:hypothetical protein